MIQLFEAYDQSGMQHYDLNYRACQLISSRYLTQNQILAVQSCLILLQLFPKMQKSDRPKTTDFNVYEKGMIMLLLASKIFS